MVKSKSPNSLIGEYCLDFIRKRRKITPGKSIREIFFIAADGMVYEGFSFMSNDHIQRIVSTVASYNFVALGISFIGNYSNRSLNSHEAASLRDFIRKEIGFGRIRFDFILYHQSQQTLNSNFSKNRLFRTLQTWNHWKASRVLWNYCCDEKSTEIFSAPSIVSVEKCGENPRKFKTSFHSTTNLRKSIIFSRTNGISCIDLVWKS